MQLKSTYNELPFDEKANVITHGMGILLCLLYGCILFLNLENSGFTNELLGIIVFTIGSTILYAASTIYHFQIDERKKEFWNIADHMAIYFLIGGSYTLFILKYFDSREGIEFLVVHWVLIAIGVAFKAFYTGKYESISVLFYLFLGWMVVYIYNPITANMSDISQIWLMIGGASYTIGVIFYVWERYKINHAIWHIFVLIGTFAHFYSYYLGM
jgi:hemolysin III